MIFEGTLDAFPGLKI
jgi:aminocarboxymuconate-semialdehyde decarboxylase